LAHRGTTGGSAAPAAAVRIRIAMDICFSMAPYADESYRTQGRPDADV
jgi:hypothetical protein